MPHVYLLPSVIVINCNCWFYSKLLVYSCLMFNNRCIVLSKCLYTSPSSGKFKYYILPLSDLSFQQLEQRNNRIHCKQFFIKHLFKCLIRTQEDFLVGNVLFSSWRTTILRNIYPMMFLFQNCHINIHASLFIINMLLVSACTFFF